ncbi:RDD family protein [Bacillus sp. FJAT-50079]|uniref:RDD family protein n=1 Tax=Bacillus sp. FJAT-50079 TaxID=2833577 RepID=UPI001BC99F7F|nr:RDD family protein [Bacillus sp. FJAT-50079]MBS4208753.1 RDD family protein [Bacillus sp. FJAT-50079]
MTMEENHQERIEPQAIHTEVPEQRYAGFWMRFWAYLLDLIIIFSLNGLLVKPIFRAFDISLSKAGIISAYGIAAGLIFYLYFILMTKYFSQTLGKMVFGLKVVSLQANKLSWSTIIFREGVGRYISATLQFLYIIAAFTPKKQALHDLFADTTVVHER